MKAPLNRDQQIAFMDRAKERDDARLARWKKDAVINELLTTPPVRKAVATVEHYTRTEKVLRCG